MTCLRLELAIRIWQAATRAYPQGEMSKPDCIDDIALSFPGKLLFNCVCFMKEYLTTLCAPYHKLCDKDTTSKDPPCLDGAGIIDIVLFSSIYVIGRIILLSQIWQSSVGPCTIRFDTLSVHILTSYFYAVSLFNFPYNSLRRTISDITQRFFLSLSDDWSPSTSW